MQTLDHLYTKAKEELATSYADNIGGFYEGMGQSGVSEDMRESVLAAIDSKADAYSAYLAEHDIYADITDPGKQWLKLDDGYMAARLREHVASSSVGTPAAPTASNPAPYSTDDLAFPLCTPKIFPNRSKNRNGIPTPSRTVTPTWANISPSSISPSQARWNMRASAICCLIC